METQEVRTDRLRHEVLRAGRGRPLLLLHGLTASKEDFAAHVDAFATLGWDVVAPDQRGHGASDWTAPVDAAPLAALTADAWALADRLGWDEVVVVGHSLGGVVAQLMALGTPERVGGMALVASIPGPLPGLPTNRARAVAGRLRRAGSGLVGRVRGRDAGIEDAEADVGTAPHSPEVVAAIVDEMLRTPDRSEALRHVGVPTLVLGGELDVDHLHGSLTLGEAIPGARLVVLDGVGHCPPTDAPERFRAEVGAFLADLPAAARERDPGQL